MNFGSVTMGIMSSTTDFVTLLAASSRRPRFLSLRQLKDVFCRELETGQAVRLLYSAPSQKRSAKTGRYNFRKAGLKDRMTEWGQILGRIDFAAADSPYPHPALKTQLIR
jgi:hypothetical protein